MAWRPIGAEFDIGKYYYIQSRISGLYLDVEQGSKAVGDNVCQAIKHHLQVWSIEPSDTPGYYYIRSRVSGLCLDVEGGNKDVGGNVCQAREHPLQVWRFEVAE